MATALQAKAKEIVDKALGNGGGTLTPDPKATLVPDKTRPSGRNGISQPFSFLKLGNSLLQGDGFVRSDDDSCQYEAHVSQQLKNLYKGKETPLGMTPRATLVPLDTAALVQMAESDKEAREFVELHERVKGFRVDGISDDAANRIREKAMNLSDESAGGIFRGPTTLGDMVDIMRNTLVFTKAGATDITLPSNGTIRLPKKVGSTVSYHEGEGFTLTPETQQKFGSVDMLLKKLFCISTITNEMTRFATVDGEAMLRTDMGESAARKMDKTMLQGLSATLNTSSAKAPRGLITYGKPTALGGPLTAWAEYEDWLIEYTAQQTGADGDTLQPEDIALMISKLPDEIQESDNLKFIGRNDFFAVITNRRADAVTAGDKKGLFVNSVTRTNKDKMERVLNGYPFIGSSQVSNARKKGSGTALTYLLAGDFKNWMIARLPVAEFVPNSLADSNFRSDTTSLRMVQFYDAAPRHASAFVLCDNLVIG